MYIVCPGLGIKITPNALQDNGMYLMGIHALNIFIIGLITSRPS
jgi:hypothetical protein